MLSSCQNDILDSFASDAVQTAHAPISGFHVGAALQTRCNHVFTGANIEHTLPHLTLCAERVALAKAIAHGAHHQTIQWLEKIAITTSYSKPKYALSPCGACRQALIPFSSPQTTLKAPEKNPIPFQDYLPFAFSYEPLPSVQPQDLISPQKTYNILNQLHQDAENHTLSLQTLRQQTTKFLNNSITLFKQAQQSCLIQDQNNDFFIGVRINNSSLGLSIDAFQSAFYQGFLAQKKKKRTSKWIRSITFISALNEKIDSQIDREPMESFY